MKYHFCIEDPCSVKDENGEELKHIPESSLEDPLEDMLCEGCQ